MNDRALNRDEAEMVARSQAADKLSPTELVELVKRLRNRRDRAQRMIRTRSRTAEQGKAMAAPDTGAREKKAQLTQAISRVTAEIDRRGLSRQAATARRNLERALERKTTNPPWRGPEDHTADTGPVETPNTKIAPSGALHAEGMRAAIMRSTGDR